MDLQMTDAVSFQEVVKLLRGRVWIHHVAVLLGEHIVEIPPTVAEVGDMPILLQTVLRQRFAEPFGDRNGADTALGLWLLLTSLTVAELINTAFDRYALVLKINVRPFKPYGVYGRVCGRSRSFSPSRSLYCTSSSAVCQECLRLKFAPQ